MPTWLLVARKIDLADLRHGRQPLADDLLGILVPFGGVEVADALEVGGAEQAVEPGGFADGPVVEQGHLDARLAQLPLRQDGLVISRFGLLRRCVAGDQTGGRRRRHHARLEEYPAIHGIGMRFVHLSVLLDSGNKRCTRNPPSRER